MPKSTATVTQMPGTTSTTEPLESDLLKLQLARVQRAFYDEKTRPTDLKALSVEMRELRSLIKAAEASEKKTNTVVADTPDEPLR